MGVLSPNTGTANAWKKKRRENKFFFPLFLSWIFYMGNFVRVIAHLNWYMVSTARLVCEVRNRNVLVLSLGKKQITSPKLHSVSFQWRNIYCEFNRCSILFSRTNVRSSAQSLWQSQTSLMFIWCDTGDRGKNTCRLVTHEFDSSKIANRDTIATKSIIARLLEWL